ncbi:M56 family metallopeptidase [Corallibacter sp.]|uniref:M56 family metallopeptidase n=1 Tax=Corallibacter sp. TaxID=2038084 RepID=UPI003A8E0500
MISYLLKFSACLAVFMLFYKFFLEKESFHKFKRGYLLGTLIVSAIIPLITFTTYIEVSPIEVPAYNSEIATPPYVPEHMLEGPAKFWSIILWSIYLIGVLVFTIRFGMNLSNILKRIKHNPKFKNHSVIHVLLSDLVHPHTFLNYIFLNKSKYEAHEIPEEVLLHEETHAKQKHALDILFIEILQILFWFNPLIYFIKKDIKLNHEFLADQAVLNNGFELKNYQNTLLAFSSNAQEPQLANAINYSSIKKRFTVMKTHTSKHIIWARSLVLLPLLAILIYSFSGQEDVIKETPQILLPQEKNKNEINVVDSVKKKLENVNSLEVVYKNKQQEINPLENINITISANGEIYVNNTQTDFETFESAINSISATSSNEEKNKILVLITLLEKNVEMGVLTEIKETLRNFGYSKFEINTHQKENPVLEITKSPLKLFLNGKQTSLENLKEDFNKITGGQKSDLNINSKGEDIDYKLLQKILVEIKDNLGNATLSDGILRDHNKTELVKNENNTYSIKSINYSGTNAVTQKQQKGASKEQIAEYNKLAKYYNSQKGSNYTIKLSDMNRIKYLYDLMTDKQRKSAEPLPNFPPPPPPTPAPEAVSEKDKAGKAHTYKYTDKNGKAVKVEVVEKDAKTPPPPPPPVPANATKEQKEKYQKISEEYYKKYKVENGKVSEREPLPPAPSAPKASAPKPPKAPEVIEVVEEHNIPSPSSTKSAFEFVQSLKNDDITYYYNKKKVSYDEILKIVKKEPNINISTNIKNNKGTVKFWSVK